MDCVLKCVNTYHKYPANELSIVEMADTKLCTDALRFYLIAQLSNNFLYVLLMASKYGIARWQIFQYNNCFIDSKSNMYKLPILYSIVNVEVIKH